MADDKAKDILHTLQRRGVVGDGVKSSVGRRAWERPRVAISSRLYRQYRVPDPWDPESKKDSTPIGLGPVSLRLGQKRRPAPHLKPKEPKKPQQRLGIRSQGFPMYPRPSAPAAPCRPRSRRRERRRQRSRAPRRPGQRRSRRGCGGRGSAWWGWRRAVPGETEPARGVAPALPVRPDRTKPSVPDSRARTDRQGCFAHPRRGSSRDLPVASNGGEPRHQRSGRSAPC